MRYLEIIEAVTPPLKLYHGSNAPVTLPFRRLTHFGTRDAAVARCINRGPEVYLYETIVSIRKPLRIRDGKNWNHSLYKLIDMLYYTMKRISSYERGLLFDAAAKGEEIGADALVVLLASKGFDGFVYNNAHEDAGNDSWVIFESGQANVINLEMLDKAED